MRNLSISARLVIGFTIVVALSLALAVFQLSNFRHAIRILDAVTGDDAEILADLTSIVRQRSALRGIREAAVAETALAAAGGGQVQVQRLARRYAEGGVNLLKDVAELERRASALATMGASRDRRRIWEDMATTSRNLGVMLDGITTRGAALLELLERGRVDDAVAIRREIDIRQEALEREIDRAWELVSMLTKSGRADIIAAYDGAMESAVLAIVAVVLIGAGAAVVIGRSITSPLGRFVDQVQTISQGELGGRVPEGSGGELGLLGTHLNGMTASLRDFAVNTRSVSEDLNAAVAQIRASAQEQAAAVTQQLSAVEETNATLAEITQSGAQILDRAQEVERSSLERAGSSEQGLKAVEATVQAMASIREQVDMVARTIVSLSERTQAIGEIILTVNAIAERAHLLALNASIEAAAAGEHGRTFSVVAGEIKRLADQSRDATSRVRSNLGEIQQGINASVMLAEEAAKRVDGGRRQTEETDRTIRGMADSIHESVQAFQQIVAATNQHQIGLEQVSQALQSIRQASSQTASTTRQLEGAAGSLGALSQQLLEATRKYKI